MQWFAVVLAGAISRTAHGNPLAVQTTGTLPFSIDELDAALVLRTTLSEPHAAHAAHAAHAIDARVIGDGTTITITVSGRTRRVELDDQRGADAARLVAFELLDLAGDQLDPPAGRAVEPPLEAPGEAAAPALEAHDRLDHLAPTTTGDAPAWSAALLATGGTRQEVSLELGRRLHGPLRAVVSGGVGLASSTTVMTDTVIRRAFPIRLALGWRHGSLEARAGAIVMIERASADRSTTELIAGGGGSLLWSPIRAHGIAATIAVGGDGFAQTIDYRVGGRPVVTTDRFAWWGGLGLAWELP